MKRNILLSLFALCVAFVSFAQDDAVPKVQNNKAYLVYGVAFNKLENCLTPLIIMVSTTMSFLLTDRADGIVNAIGAR